MPKVKVRVTMFTDPIEVEEDEIANLRHQGLLIEDDKDLPETPAPKAKESQA